MAGSRFERAAIRFYLVFVLAGLVSFFVGLNALVIGTLAALQGALGVQATEGPASLLPGVFLNVVLAAAGYALTRGGLFLVFGTIRNNFMRF